MPSGGHARSGPPVDPRSGRSDRRGLSFESLPASGYDGEVPDFPLPRQIMREKALWAWAWATPQAFAWAREPWRWHTVAMWVRTAALCEARDARSSDKAVLRQLTDDIGLSSAGLKYNGWTIAEKPSEDATPRLSAVPSARDRFEVIDGGA